MLKNHLLKDDKEKFFNLLSIEMDTGSIESTQKAYYGLIKMITKTLKNDKVIVLPDFGMFTLKTWKPRGLVMIFKSCKRLKNFWRYIEDKSR